MNCKPANPRSHAASVSLFDKIALAAKQVGAITRALPALLAFGFIFSVGPQLDAQAASTGFVAGRVFSAKTGNALPGAPVYLDGATAPASTTDSSGSFTITGLAPGEHSLRVTYSDLDSLTKTVIVEAGVAATVEFSLSSSIYMLDAFVVAAEREGQAFAISQQRQSDVMKNVVSADAFGNILDTNAGEILKTSPAFCQL
ncbi:carboxypeptidase-like regulatory domain-containing protein [Termitidicoccus mucosus]|uniref:carboxypeptidase-like regulatory domain-containing protein n=1 Tax=Termitidicoccus mucosus TaxID=1184151 RepID=UPI003183899A